MRAGLSVSVSAGLTGGRVIGRVDPEREMRARAGGCVMRTQNEREREQKHRLVHIIYKSSKVVGRVLSRWGRGD